MKKCISIKKGIHFIIHKNFTIYSNQQIQAKETIQGKDVIYDYNLSEYDNVIQALLEKRWTTKQEIAPKMHIIDSLAQIQPQLYQQTLTHFKSLYDLERMEKCLQVEAINSNYLISLVSEPYFKEMLDEYVQKVLINGSVVPLKLYKQQEEIEQKIKKLFHTFFYGDNLTGYEMENQFRYLVFKQQKYFNYQNSNKPKFRCIWTYSDQKRVELIENWRARDINFYDDYRPIYMPLKIENKIDYSYLTMQINRVSIFSKLFFNFFEKSSFQRSKKRANWVTHYLLTRTMLYCNSIEFTHVLNIPPDFHIEHSILNMHLWLLIDRLKKINSLESKYMAKHLEHQFKRLTLDKVQKIHLKKKNDFIKDVNHFMLNTRIMFDKHFNLTEKTKQNPYHKIDALIWSTLFFEKVPRFSEPIYLMSEYLIKQYEYMESLDFQRFLDCDIHFDVFKSQIDYKQVILHHNPQLSEEEFEKELESDNKIKKFYYTYEDQSKSVIDEEVQNKNFDTLNDINIKILQTARKYQNLETYDYFSEREEKEKLNKSKQKYIWSQNEQQIEDVDSLREQLKNKRKN